VHQGIHVHGDAESFGVGASREQVKQNFGNEKIFVVECLLKASIIKS